MFQPQESTNINYAWRRDSLQTLVLWHTVASFSKLWQIVMLSCQLFIWLLYGSTNMYRDKGESAPLWPALTFFFAPQKTQGTEVVSLVVPFYLIENTWIKNIWMKLKKVLTPDDQTSSFYPHLSIEDQCSWLVPRWRSKWSKSQIISDPRRMLTFGLTDQWHQP